jgi:hypothetical protein
MPKEGLRQLSKYLEPVQKQSKFIKNTYWALPVTTHCTTTAVDTQMGSNKAALILEALFLSWLNELHSASSCT